MIHQASHFVVIYLLRTGKLTHGTWLTWLIRGICTWRRRVQMLVNPLCSQKKTIGKKGGCSYFLCSWCIMYPYRIICIDIIWYLIFLENHRFGPTAISQTPSRCFPLLPSVSRCFIFGPLQLQGVCVRGELSMSAKLPGVRINGLAWGKIYRKPWILHDLPIILGGILQLCPPKKRKKRGSSSDSMWNLYISPSCH